MKVKQEFQNILLQNGIDLLLVFFYLCVWYWEWKKTGMWFLKIDKVLNFRQKILLEYEWDLVNFTFLLPFTMVEEVAELPYKYDCCWMKCLDKTG